MSIQFENKETEDYYKKMRRNLGVGPPKQLGQPGSGHHAGCGTVRKRCQKHSGLLKKACEILHSHFSQRPLHFCRGLLFVTVSSVCFICTEVRSSCRL